MAGSSEPAKPETALPFGKQFNYNQKKKHKYIMQHEIINIGPELATKYLQYNTKNRSINWRHVEFLSNQMAAGDWRENGDTVRFTKSGVLADGQQRLHAIIKSGTTVPTLVVTGLDEDIINFIDTNSRPRSHSDVLYLNKYKNTSLLSSIYPIVNAYYTGGKGYKERVSSKAVLEFVEQNPEAETSAGFASSHKPWLVPISLVASFHYIASKAGKQAKAEDFLIGFNTGANLSAGNPILSLRNIIIAARKQGKTSWPRQMKLTTLGRFIRTYNNWSQGISQPSHWTYKAGKQFPIIIDAI